MSDLKSIPNRQDKKIIEVEGERVTPHSKFWVWEDILWEPAYYGGTKTGRYRSVKSAKTIARVMKMAKNRNRVIKVSDVMDTYFEKPEQITRFDMLDLEEE